MQEILPRSAEKFCAESENAGCVMKGVCLRAERNVPVLGWSPSDITWRKPPRCIQGLYASEKRKRAHGAAMCWAAEAKDCAVGAISCVLL